MEAGKQCNGIFKVQKENSYEPMTLYQAKILFKIKIQLKKFHTKNEFVTNVLSLEKY